MGFHALLLTKLSCLQATRKHNPKLGNQN